MYKHIRVLSLFDGISCGQVVLNRLGIDNYSYFSSEIDPHAIKVVMDNYPNTIQIGDVSFVDGKSLGKIDLLMGGSPCQGFSRSGKQLNFDDPRSRLFFEYYRLLKEINPKYFLLENVNMHVDYQRVISRYLGVKPVMINSSLFTPQHRERLYWTNIPFELNVLPCSLMVKHIVESYSLPSILKKDLYFVPKEKGSISASRNGIICLGGVRRRGEKKRASFSQGNRVYSEHGKAITLSATSGGVGSKTGLYMIGTRIRKLTVKEAERLQGIPEGYTSMVSPNQSLKLLGNGWSLPVVEHLLEHMPSCKSLVNTDI